MYPLTFTTCFSLQIQPVSLIVDLLIDMTIDYNTIYKKIKLVEYLLILHLQYL